MTQEEHVLADLLHQCCLALGSGFGATVCLPIEEEPRCRCAGALALADRARETFRG